MLKSGGKYSNQQTLKSESKVQHVTETSTLPRKTLVYSHGIMGSCGVGLEARTDSGLWGVWCRGWKLERIADYGACGVGLEARKDSGLWGV